MMLLITHDIDEALMALLGKHATREQPSLDVAPDGEPRKKIRVLKESSAEGGAFRLFDGNRQVVRVTVAGAEDTPLDRSSDSQRRSQMIPRPDHRIDCHR